MSEYQVGRRLLLGGVGVTLLSTGLTLPAWGDAGMKVEALGEMVHMPVSPRESALIPRVLGVSISGVRTLPRGLRIDFDYDPTLYDLAPNVAVRSGRHAQRLSLPATRKPSRQRRDLSVVIPRTIPIEDECAVWVGALSPRWFPHDSARLLPPGRHTVGEVGQTERGLRVGRRQEAQFWGVRLGCQWRRISLGGPYVTFAPELVSLASVGPWPSAPDLTVSVALDTSVGLRLTGAEIVSATHKARLAGIHTSPTGMQFDVVGSLPPGGSVSIALRAQTGVALQGPLSQLDPPLVEVCSRRPSPGQRATGCESATRLDSIHSAETLQQWGPQ